MSAAASGGATQLVTMLFTFLILMIPFAILNASIARRKGRSGAEFGWLSVIPFVGFFIAIYLVSLTDKVLQDKVDKILQVLSAQGAQLGDAAPFPVKNDPWINRPPEGT